jgi:hypothetical protein
VALLVGQACLVGSQVGNHAAPTQHFILRHC